MKIRNLLSSASIDLDAKVSNKMAAIDHLVDLMDKSGRITDKEVYKQGILAREEQFSTGVGEGIAIPHAKNSAVKEASLSAMVVKDGVDYESLDGEPSYLFFMIAAPEKGADTHLQTLARLSQMLMDPDFKQSLLDAKSVDEFLANIDKKEAEIEAEESGTSSESVASSDSSDSSDKTEAGSYPRVIALTACPTGIAHTFMAAESLTRKGEELGIYLKVETHGQGGVKNSFTKEEIENAEAVIVASDRNLDLSRFDGKKMIKTKVADGIHKPEELINRALSDDAPIYRHDGAVNHEESKEEESVGRRIYKNLMNGVTHMLPFVIGGGILIAIAFLLDDYTIDPANFGSNTPVAKYFMNIGGLAFGMMLPVLSGYIAMSIADRPGLAVGFVGGLVAKAGTTFANPAGGDVNAGFLGALLAGFVAGYVVIGLKKLFSKLPTALEGMKSILIYPIAGILITAIITTALNPFMGTINDGLNSFLHGLGGTSKIFLGIILGAMMSADMGGPINKAAYVFGTSQLAANNFEIMAAVMAGGMVPPIAIALSTTFFKNKWTKRERQSGYVNYILGLSFITEGAIPYAAGDPIRVLPSCIIGSGVAGGLSMLFGCTLRAPHGGIFVVPTIGNPVMYLVAVAVGAVVGGVILSLLKKPVKE